ncbi:Hypothetical predicted protein [Marmota monax]|uniref:Uncharacterized protein n=1 Tax=Marmota monax TaxID=9995 RepID=A0A5E4BVE0_MARMO|nr:Hypothetical predicted protein [Marmota monax]
MRNYTPLGTTQGPDPCKRTRLRFRSSNLAAGPLLLLSPSHSASHPGCSCTQAKLDPLPGHPSDPCRADPHTQALLRDPLYLREENFSAPANRSGPSSASVCLVLSTKNPTVRISGHANSLLLNREDVNNISQMTQAGRAVLSAPSFPP